MQGSHPARDFLRKSLRCLWWLFRLCLCINLALLLLATAIILIKGELPVPRFLLDGLRQQAARAGYVVNWGSIHINLTGQLLVEELEVGVSPGENGRLLQARAVLVDIHPLRMLFGHVLPRRVVADDLTLSCPAIVSPSGKTEVLTEDLSVNLYRKDGQWELTTFRAQIFNLHLRAAGTIPAVWLEAVQKNTLSQPAATPRPLLRNYGEFAQLLLNEAASLQALQQPYLLLRFSPRELTERSQTQTAATGQRSGQRGSAAARTISKEPVLDITLDLGANGFDDKSLRLSSGPLFARSAISLDEHARISVISPPYATARDLDWDGNIRAKAAIVRMPHPPTNSQSLAQALISPLDTLTIASWDLNVYGMPLKLARLHVMTANGVDLLQGQDYILRANIANGWNHLTAFAHIDRSEMIGYVDFIASWNPEDLNAIPVKDRPAALKEGIPVDFSKAPYLAGHLVLGHGLVPQWANLRVSTAAMSYGPLALSYAHVDALWDSHSINISQALAYGASGYRVQGGYWQNLKTDQYRIYAEGSLDPAELNLLVDQLWWTQLWEQFDFDPQYWPQASFAMVGTHNMGIVGKKVFVAAQMRHNHFNGVPIEASSALLYMNGDTVDLYDLALENAHGHANAHVRWITPADINAEATTAFVATSTFPVEQVGLIIGEETAATLNDFKAALPPRASAVGVLMSGQQPNAPSELYLKLHLDVASTFTFKWLMMDTISAHVLITPATRELTGIEGGIAGGQLSGDAYLDVTDAENIVFKTQLDVTDAHLDRLDTALAFLKADSAEPAAAAADTADATPPATPDSSASADSSSNSDSSGGGNGDSSNNSGNGGGGTNLLSQPGIVDFSGEIHGIAGNIGSMHGSGQAAIHNSDLAQIHLLGVVSQLFQFLRMPVATLDFSQAQTKWELNNGIAHLPDLRIYGSTGLIDANGNIDLETMQLNFIVYLHPLGEFSLPLISQALSLLSPLANFIQVNITGSLANPQFNTSFRPGNIFSGPNLVPAHQMAPLKVQPQTQPPVQKMRKLRGPVGGR